MILRRLARKCVCENVCSTIIPKAIRPTIARVQTILTTFLQRSLLALDSSRDQYFSGTFFNRLILSN